MILFGVECDGGGGGKVEAEGMSEGVVLICGVLGVGVRCIDSWVVNVGNM
jgi:hypothetical protein